MLPLRLVIDSNVIVSAILQPKGNERAAAIFALTSPAKLFISSEILEEYQLVLARPKFGIFKENSKEFIKLIRSKATLVKPESNITQCPDPDDNKFLACAFEAKADYLITGNLKHFPHFWYSTKIVNARKFLSIISPHLKV